MKSGRQGRVFVWKFFGKYIDFSYIFYMFAL